MKAWNAVLPHIARRITGAVATAFGSRSLSGGCINQAIKLTLRDQAYFVKLNRADSLEMFETEAAGLEALATSGAIRTPGVVCSGQWGDHAYLVLEYIPLQNTGDQALAGRQLAALHRAAGPHYGWKQDNYIGATPQPNTPDDSWVEFWHGQRLGFQLALAERRGYGGALQVAGARLLGRLPALLDHNPPVSLLHGDLWSGNLGYDRNGAPVIYDPAVYYGDRECDLAMSELFGGFSELFYRAYDEAWPLDEGYATRKTLYNLYHILNHLNLFGGGYGPQALAMIDQLLAEPGV